MLIMQKQVGKVSFPVVVVVVAFFKKKKKKKQKSQKDCLKLTLLSFIEL